MSNDQKYIIIAISIIIVCTIGYIFATKKKIEKLKHQLIIEKIDKVEQLTPIIESERDGLIITSAKIEQQSQKIQYLLDSMENLSLDTISLEQAIEILKDRSKHAPANNNSSDMLRY